MEEYKYDYQVEIEEINKRLDKMLVDMDRTIKVFEKTHDFDYISDYNIYTFKDLIKEFKELINHSIIKIPNQN